MSLSSSPSGTIVLTPGTLWKRTLEQSTFALNCGALHSIPTTYEWIEQAGIPFLVRVLANLERKRLAQQAALQKPVAAGQSMNPFLPYERDLFVADLSPTHLCLLNKFNVVDHHLLIITREYEDQDTWLTLRDFEALAACMVEIEGLAFYNGGRDAGASQRHKHLQLVPLPMVPESFSVPIETAIAPLLNPSSPAASPLPYRHAVAPLNLNWDASAIDLAHGLLQTYQQLLAQVNLVPRPEDPRQTGAYNLLATRQWMMIVPRSRDAFEGIAVNALGFAGALLVRNHDQLAQLKTYEPLTILQNVAFSPHGN
jgi:ATP adenylyltransferase